MLTPRQQQVVKLASYRAADAEWFDAFITDAVTGRQLSDHELHRLVDEALALTRRG